MSLNNYEQFIDNNLIKKYKNKDKIYLTFKIYYDEESKINIYNLDGELTKKVSGEFIYLYNKIKNLCHKDNKFNKILIIPFLNFISETHNMIKNCIYNYIFLYVKFKSIYDLIKIKNNDITNLKNIKNIIKNEFDEYISF